MAGLDAAIGSTSKKAPPPPGDDALNAALGMDDATALQARMAQSRERQERFAEQADRDTASIETAQGKLRDLKPPTPPEIPKPPEIKNRPPEEAFGSLAMIMAMAGSLMTRRPFVNALSSGAEVMKAFQAGDEAAQKSAIEVWHTNVENAKALHQFQQDTYEQDLKGIDTDLKGSIAMLQAHARAFQDEATAQLADTGMIRELHEHIDRMKKNGDAFTVAQEKLAQDKWKVEKKDQPTMSPEAIHDDAVRFVTKGDKSVFRDVGFGVAGNANRSAIKNEAHKVMVALGMSPQDITSNEAIMEGLITESRTVGRRAGQLRIASSAARGMADKVKESSMAVPRTQFMPINELLNTARENLGSPEVVAFQAAINTFINGYARAISPTGVATVSDKDHARAMLSMAQTQEQVDAVLGMLKSELVVEQKAVSEAFAGIGIDVENITDDQLAAKVQAGMSESPRGKAVLDYKASLESDPPKTIEEARARFQKYLGGMDTADSLPADKPPSDKAPGKGLGSGPSDPAPFPSDGNWQPNKFYRAKTKDGTRVEGYYNPTTKELEANPF